MSFIITIVATIFVAFNTNLIHAQNKNIVEVAIENGNFTTLVAALNLTNLATTLEGTGPFTVFAPVDSAFNALPSGVLEDLIKPENNETLATILLYHTASGNITSDEIKAMTLPTELPMIAGGNTTISMKDGNIFVDQAQVTTADVFATNGVIHVLDKVLIPSLDIVGTALVNGNFKTLITALTAADLVATLKGTGPFTVFAPTDAAFAKLPPGTVADLLKPENKQKLIEVLTYHVVASRTTAEDLLNMNLPVQLNTVSSLRLIADKDGSTVKLNDATVTTANVMSTNGIIHVIDTVLLPPTKIPGTAVAQGNFKTLVQALTVAGLVDTLNTDGPFTVFAPNDEAFNKLPSGAVSTLTLPQYNETLSKILKHHVTGSLITSKSIGRMTLPAQVPMLDGTSSSVSVNGGNVLIDGATVIVADVFNANGMIHVIDNVIVPPLDIVERSVSCGVKILLDALKAADLSSTLEGNGPFTLFAPTDEAFKKLPNGTLDFWLQADNKDELVSVLKYHVLSGKYLKVNLTAGQNLDTLNGKSIEVKVNGSQLMIDDAVVIVADIGATNGVIHLIDTVLIPSSATLKFISWQSLFFLVLCSLFRK